MFSILLILAFGAWQHILEHHPSPSRPPPLVKLSMLTRNGWKIAAVNAASYCVFTAVPGWIYLTSILYQKYRGETPLQNAIKLLPACFSGALAAVSVGLAGVVNLNQRRSA